MAHDCQQQMLFLLPFHFYLSKSISGILDKPNPPGKYVFTSLSIFDFLSALHFLRSIRFLITTVLSAFRIRILSSSLKETSIFFPDEITRSVKRLTLFAAPKLNFNTVSTTAIKTSVRPQNKNFGFGHIGHKIPFIASRRPRPPAVLLSANVFPLFFRLYSRSAAPILFCMWQTHSSFMTT